jgi:hypothetical protein
VLTANQVLVWHRTQAQPPNVKIEGDGRIFDRQLPTN